jgi:hypothetical protein
LAVGEVGELAGVAGGAQRGGEQDELVDHVEEDQ